MSNVRPHQRSSNPQSCDARTDAGAIKPNAAIHVEVNGDGNTVTIATPTQPPASWWSRWRRRGVITTGAPAIAAAATITTWLGHLN
ncbi:hypothetical protein [Actinokineospora terrae]|uniref:Uncharacterized protein n=1 Tax=Actinokineospora terrae TaxID=155974 RepID=A0A1H9X7Z5_9PSEU|nr:hypothetical protein [Actinokineospora terrae]SES42328.1 hypothetical protein SAMN04487818_113126 [Actinokineospora terrae]